MFNSREINEFMNEYIEEMSKINFEKKQTLERFREIEINFKFYQEALNELEKQQSKVNLAEFKNLKDKTIEILSDIDCKDMDFNIRKVKETIYFFEELEVDLIEVSDSLIMTKKIWKSFEQRNEDIIGTIFSKHIYEKIQEVEDSINKVTPNEIGILTSSIDELKSYIEKLMLKIEKIKEYYYMNIFIGEENELIKLELEKIIDFKSLNSIDFFMNKSDDLIDIIDKAKENAKSGIVKVPTYKVYTKNSKDIFKFTLKFGDHFLKYDHFFKNNDLKYVDYKEYLYLDNFPIKGIFSGREVVENLSIEDKYIDCVNEIGKVNYRNFIIFSSILILIGFVIPFLGITAAIIYLFITIGSMFLFKKYIRFTKRKIDKKFKRPRSFVYNKIDFLFTHIGEDTSLEELLLGIIRDFDNTIINKKFHERLEHV